MECYYCRKTGNLKKYSFEFPFKKGWGVFCNKECLIKYEDKYYDNFEKEIT